MVGNNTTKIAGGKSGKYQRVKAVLKIIKRVTLAIGSWHSFQPSERVIHESNGNRFSLSWGRGPG
jgi:hypothetical protein